jgi:5'-nucleotidase
LGGHDHMFFYHHTKSNIAIKSGTDFRELTLNKVTITELDNYTNKNFSQKTNCSDSIYQTILYKKGLKIQIDTELIKVTKNMKENESIAKYITMLEQKIDAEYTKTIGYLLTDVDARFTSVRTTNLPISNFITDLLKIYFQTDCVIVNSGTLRIDSVIFSGELE